MLDRDEELADGNRLCAMADMWESADLGRGGITTEACDTLIDAYAAIGVADASAHVVRRACFSCLSLLLDFNPGNFGAIRTFDSDVWRVAPIFDYDGSFGFPFNGVSLSDLCENPLLVELFYAIASPSSGHLGTGLGTMRGRSMVSKTPSWRHSLPAGACRRSSQSSLPARSSSNAIT